MFEVGYTYGWRHEELLDLRVRQVDISAGTIRLEPGTTKNDEGREVSMTLPVKALLSQCVCGKTGTIVFSLVRTASLCAISEVHGQMSAKRPRCPVCCFTICGGQRREICEGLESQKV
jgi:hypothetical protein